jgi:hypothetical protein
MEGGGCFVIPRTCLTHHEGEYLFAGACAILPCSILGTIHRGTPLHRSYSLMPSSSATRDHARRSCLPGREGTWSWGLRRVPAMGLMNNISWSVSCSCNYVDMCVTMYTCVTMWHVCKYLHVAASAKKNTQDVWDQTEASLGASVKKSQPTICRKTSPFFWVGQIGSFAATSRCNLSI